MKIKILICAGLAVLLFCPQAWCGTIDPDGDGHCYAWSENQGWLNFNPDNGPGVTVTDNALTGYVWLKNTGWIRLDPEGCSDCGVKKDAQGNLTGWGWGENIGWISFSCANADTGSRVDYGVVIDPVSGAFSGHAWSEGLGWIRFDHSQAANYGVKTYLAQLVAIPTFNQWGILLFSFLLGMTAIYYLRKKEKAKCAG